MKVMKSKKVKEDLVQKLAKYTLLGFLSFLVIINITSNYIMPGISENVVNSILFTGTALFTLSAGIMLSIIAKQDKLLSSDKPKRESWGFGILMFLILAATIFFITLIFIGPEVLNY